jgi:hypothetical protein
MKIKNCYSLQTSFVLRHENKELLLTLRLKTGKDGTATGVVAPRAASRQAAAADGKEKRFPLVHTTIPI